MRIIFINYLVKSVGLSENAPSALLFATVPISLPKTDIEWQSLTHKFFHFFFSPVTGMNISYMKCSLYQL